MSALVMLGLSGCFLAAAGAGAAGAIYLTDNGAEALIDAPMDEAFQASQQTFQEMNIVQTEMTQSDGGESKRELKGTAGDRDVTVTIERDGENSRVEVTVKTSPVVWDKEYARSVLQRIVEKTS